MYLPTGEGANDERQAAGGRLRKTQMVARKGHVSGQFWAERMRSQDSVNSFSLFDVSDPRSLKANVRWQAVQAEMGRLRSKQKIARSTDLESPSHTSFSGYSVNPDFFF